MLRHDRRGTLRFASLQSRYAAQFIARHAELMDVDSLLWVEAPAGGDERYAVRSEAVLRVAAYLGGAWRLSLLGRALPSRLRDAVYDLLARHRHQLFTPALTCYVPPAGERARFLA